MNTLDHVTPWLTDLQLPLLIAGIVLAVSLARLVARILGRLVDRVLPPNESDRCAHGERAKS